MKFLARYNRIRLHLPWEILLLASALAFFAWQVCHPTLAFHLSGNHVIFAICFAGILLFAMLFTALQYFQNKDKSYLFYSIYLTISLLYLIHSSPKILWMLVGNEGVVALIWLFDSGHHLGFEFFLSLLLMASYCLFVQQFFDLKNNFPRFHRWVNFGYWLLLAYCVLTTLSLAIASFPELLQTSLKFTLAAPAMYVLICIFKTKNRLFNLILLGTALLMAGAAASGLVSYFMKNGGYPAELEMSVVRSASSHLVYLQLGMLAEILLFSTALGYKSLLTEKEKNKALLQSAEARRLQDLDTMKTRLYTNITHEFRTPLTIILGEAEQGKLEIEKLDIGKFADQPISQFLISNFSNIRRSGQQLLNLVNQMLDLAKLEAGSLSLNIQQSDVIVFLKYLLESFHSLAIAKKIHLRFDAPANGFIMDFDAEKLRQIMSNLLSNAIKFTPEGGVVRLSAVSTSSADSTFQIQVADSGMGIPAEDLPHVFDRFFQAETAAENFHPGGTGIGLTLTKELVKLLGGSIAVESEMGKGTTFAVSLPVSNQAPVSDRVTWSHPVTSSTENLGGNFKLPPKLTGSEPFNHPAIQPSNHLLIVEDNEDVLRYLTAILKNDYRLQTAPNGKAGLEKAFDLVPDLILSDVMMPEMDGYEVCRHLKNDLRTSHIPVVLLTAKADFDSRLEGLELGADAYLAKPFEERELKVVLRKLLEVREKLRQHYTSGEFLAVTARPVSTQIANRSNSQDEQFLKDLLQVVENHLDDQELSAGKLAVLLNMDYSSLYRKVKALTGMGVTEYIRHIRLHRAARLLLEKWEMKISAVAYDVGFGTPNEFSNRFKEVFKCSPKEWRATPAYKFHQ